MGVLFPTGSTIRPVSPVLQGRVIGYFNADDDYIAEKVLPSLGGVGKTGTIMNVASASGFGDPSDNLLRGYKSKYHRNIGPQLGSTTWSCEEYGDEAAVDLGMLEDCDDAIDLKMIESQVALENLRVWRERRAADLLFNTSTFTNNVTLSGGNQFSASTSDPVAVFDTGIRTVKAASGKTPNTMVLGWLPFRTVLKNASLLSYMPTTDNRNMLTPTALSAMLKDLFGIENVFVGKAHYNTAYQGQTASLSPIWGDMIWLGFMDYADPGVRVNAGSAAVSATAALRLIQTDLTSEEYADDTHRATIVRHRQKEDELVTSAVSGYIINDVTV